MFSTLGDLLSSFISKLLNSRLSFFVAIKALLITFFTVTLPFVLKGLALWLLDNLISFFNYIVSIFFHDGLIPNLNFNFDGFIGYLVIHLKLIECLSLILFAYLVKFKLKFIPFIGK